MQSVRISDRLLPRWEKDRKFRDFIGRLSWTGLRTVAAVEIVAPMLMFLGRLAAEPRTTAILAHFWQMIAVSAIGAGTLLLSNRLRRHSRLLCGVSVWSACFVLICTNLWKLRASFGQDDYILGVVALIVVTAAVSVPFRTLDMLALGFGVEATDILATWLTVHGQISAVALSGAAHHLFLLMLIVLATAVVTVNYEHRKAEYNAQQETIRVVETLTAAQLRAQLAENAISIGKLAAALSHEINTPLGTMRSSIETLLALTARQTESAPAKREIVTRMRDELCRSITESTARIEDVMLRLRRLVSLEEAELKSADVNDLLSDVTLLYQAQIDGRSIRVDFDLEPHLPRITCRPQLLSAVFSNLLSNAINAVNGDGRIRIITRMEDSTVEVTVSDNGRGMSAEEAENAFNPSLKVAEGRVASANWSLFNTRQMVYEHGGEIRIDTAEGKGTTVRVLLPLA
ncbi:MAG: hypothetical protein C5B51_18775 [Terriglobia bacterium]|nr:MAG: hypothetical protein C5B51_18775 [Terriglobia bacterium]